MDITKVRNKFKELHGTEGALFALPGRINLIGVHTAYNRGLLHPGPLDTR